MNLDYSVFKEGEEEWEEGFSDLPIEEQMSLMRDAFPIDCVVNAKYEDEDEDWHRFGKIDETIDFHVVGYITHNQPGGFYDKVGNVIIKPVSQELKPTVLGDKNTMSIHPGYLRHNKNWLRENKIESLLDK
jgi:hypothetical protein